MEQQSTFEVFQYRALVPCVPSKRNERELHESTSFKPSKIMPFSFPLSSPPLSPSTHLLFPLTLSPAECNNSTCFPGIGLGCVLSRSKLLSDKMLVAACKTLAAEAPALKDPDKGLLPDVVDVRKISVKIASAVIRTSVEERLATEQGIPKEEDELEEWVRAQMWEARYRVLRRV